MSETFGKIRLKCIHHVPIKMLTATKSEYSDKDGY